MKIGDEIKFTDGVGHQYRGKLLETGRPSVHIEILEKSERKPLSPFAMALPLIEFGRLEWALEKCVELGCAEFWFINTDRTQFTLRFETAERKRLRWHRIALEATKQSENCYVPDIQQVLALPELLNQWKGDCVAFHGSTGPASLLPQTRQQTRSGQKVPGSLRGRGPEGAWHLLSEGQRTLLLIGPEGGWSPEELALFEEKKIPIFSLGPSVLRTETAAVVSLTLCQYNFT